MLGKTALACTDSKGYQVEVQLKLIRLLYPLAPLYHFLLSTELPRTAQFPKFFYRF